MIQKIEKLLDLASEALSLYIEDARARRGETLPLQEAAAAEIPKARKPRAAKAAAPAPAESPFGTIAQPAAPVEDQLEVARRGKEVMGLFIRRFLKAQPTGLDRAKTIILDKLGQPRGGEAVWKFEHFTPADWLTLTPVFELELDKADAGAR